MIQLNITTEGLSAKARNNNLIFTKFIAGNGIDEDLQTIQSQKQEIPISFSQVYNVGDTYTANGTSYVEQIDHVKIVGTLQSSETTSDYTLSEIALMAKEGENGTEFAFAYGANEQENIEITVGGNTSYSLVIDIVFDTTPNITVNTTTTGVTNSEFIGHLNDKVSVSDVHGITYINDDLKINNVSLDICKNNIFQKTTGITIFDTLPNPTVIYDNKLAFNKATNSLYKCSKTTEIEVGDYIYQDPNDIWQVGDGTETGALEVVADSATPTNTEIKLTQAQNHFIEWNIINDLDKRLSLVENVSLGGITDIINTLQNQIASINNALSNPFPAWGASTSYVVGDICICSNFNSYKYLECVVAGTTGSTAPSNANIGNLITDNEVKWLVCDWRDNNPVGTIRQDLVVRAGYLLLNGQTINVADYPRLVNFLSTNSLISAYTAIPNDTEFTYGDSNNETLILPNFEGLFIENRVSDTLQEVNAGLPNITGTYIPNLIIDNYTSNQRKVGVHNATGAFEKTDTSTSRSLLNSIVDNTTTQDNSYKGVIFKASNSNSIYGNSSTVQPPAVKLLPIIKY